MKKNEQLLIGIAIGVGICMLMQSRSAAGGSTEIKLPIPKKLPDGRQSLPGIQRRPWAMQNPLKYIAY